MKKTLTVLMFLVVLAVSLPSKAFSFSLADEWSDAVNPTPGAWSYNQGSTPLSLNIADWPASEFGPSQTAWANGNSAPTLVPGWMKSVATPGSVYDWLAGDVIAHSTDTFSGGSHGLANVTWTSPVSGVVDISGEVWSGRDIDDRDNTWRLYLDGALLGSGSSLTGFSRASPDAFNFLGVSIGAGDILKMEIAKTSTSTFGDFVGVNLTVTPEPISTVLFFVGGMPIAVSLYKRRKFKV